MTDAANRQQRDQEAEKIEIADDDTRSRSGRRRNRQGNAGRHGEGVVADD